MTATLTPDQVLVHQRGRLREWHDKVHVMHVAHMKSAAMCERLNRGLSVFGAVFATFAGSTLATDLSVAGSVNRTLQWVAMIAGLASAVLVAVNTTMNWGKRSGEHREAATRFGAIRHDMELWRLRNPGDPPRDDPRWQQWAKEWAEIEKAAPVLSDRKLAQAEQRVRSARPRGHW
jgi:hypothetical protein